MSSRKDLLEVTVRYKGLKQTISGSPDDVTKAYFEVISKFVPSFDLASELIATPNLMEIANKLKGLISLYKGRVLVLKSDIGTEDAVLLTLMGKYLGFRLNQASTDVVTMSEIVEATGKTKKNIAVVLARLKKNGSVERLKNEGFRITDSKVHQYALKKLPKLGTLKMTDFMRRKGGYSEKETLDTVAFTIGYEERDLDDFIKVLKENGVQMLVDVRRDAYSKHNRNFNEGILSKRLTESKIRYLHIPELGVDYAERQKLRKFHNYEDYFKLYSDYIDKNPELITLLVNLSKNNAVSLMCYEKDYRRCHRRVLADKLSEKGFLLYHL